MKTENIIEKSLKSRVNRAINRFLVNKQNYKILDYNENATLCPIVAFDECENTIAFIYTDYKEDEVVNFDEKERGLKRSDFETQAIKWLATKGGDYIDVSFRFDCIIAHIIAPDRAVFRHHINFLKTLENDEN